MAEPFADPDADLSLDVYAAQLRLDHRDATEQAEALAARVEQLVPHLATRTTQGGWPFGGKTLKELRVALGAEQFQIVVQGGRAHYRTVHHVGGIDLAHHDITQQEWVQRVGQALARQAAQLDAQGPATL